MVMRILLPVALATFVLDWLSKWYVLAGLGMRVGDEVAVWPPFLQFRLLFNPGINFGLGGSADARWFLVALAVAVSGWVIWWVSRRKSAPLAFGAGLVVGGALGNAVDRVQYGAVADFLNMSCCGFDNPYSFNIADCAIFAGALWIVWKA